MVPILVTKIPKIMCVVCGLVLHLTYYYFALNFILKMAITVIWGNVDLYDL